MKTLTLIVAAVLLTLNSFSQLVNGYNGANTSQNALPAFHDTRHKGIMPKNAKPPYYNCNGQAKTAAFNLWIEPVGDVMMQLGIDETGATTGNSQGNFLDIIYQDSTVTVSDPSPATNFISDMMLGSVLDPTSQYLQPTLNPICTYTDAYNIDSIIIVASYVKVTNAVDTLYTWLVWGDTTTSSIGFTKNPTATLWVAPISTWRFEVMGPKVTGATAGPGNTMRSGVPSSNMMLVKYVLQNTDTCQTGGYTKMITIPLPNVANIPAGNIVSCYYEFVPGGTYTTGDCSYSYPGAPIAQTVNGFGGMYWGQSSPSVTSITAYQNQQVDPSSWCMGTSYFKQCRHALPGFTTNDNHLWGNLTQAPLIYYHIYGNGSTLPLPVASFTMVPDSANPLTYWAFNSSSGSGLSYYWNTGDSSGTNIYTSQSPVHTFAGAGSDNVCLTAYNSSGGNTVCHTITVSSTSNSCMALFNVAHDTSTTNPNAYKVTNLSYGANLSYLWSFGDTATSTL